MCGTEAGKRVKNKKVSNPGMKYQGGYITGQTEDFLPPVSLYKASARINSSLSTTR